MRQFQSSPYIVQLHAADERSVTYLTLAYQDDVSLSHTKSSALSRPNQAQLLVPFIVRSRAKGYLALEIALETTVSTAECPKGPRLHG
jgi:hypothetical protein